MKEVTLKEFADTYNKVLTRRDKRMSEGYIYRLIREDYTGVREAKNAASAPRVLWFKYKFAGYKDSIKILIDE